MTIDKLEFRNALGNFATGITIVTAKGPNDELLGLTANSFNSVSLDPPLVLFSLDRGAYSLKPLQASGAFAINVLCEDQQHLSTNFARSLTDKWSGVDYEIWETGSPILKGAIAVFECEIHSMYDGGDHIIFIGRVLRMRADPERRPLLYFRGRYARMSE
jgi:flavin reductase (DIM6/NTAB) family NADH-FMN oxidoreductase RutF